MNALELAGLPGSGKSTLCREFHAQYENASYSWVAKHRKRIRRTILFNAFAPVATWRFYGVLRQAARSDGRNPSTAVLGSTLAVLLRQRKQTSQSTDAVVSLHSFLALFAMELAVTRLESLLKRTFIVYDEGYVQRLVGVWLRFPVEQRQAAWDAFVAAIPADLHCALIDAAPAVALERASKRPGGISRIFEEACDTTDDPASLSRLYRDVGGRIRGLESNPRIVLHRIEDRATPAETAANLVTLVKEHANGRPVTLLLRD